MTLLLDTHMFLWFDSFDRLLVAQATFENFAIVSADEALDAYGVRRLW